MDLNGCPRCGADWLGGEKCRSCGFVPIGAGLKPSKKRKRRRRRWVEPGGSQGLLLLLLMGGLGAGGYLYKPWQNDWSLVRDLLGVGSPHPLTGDWEIVKSVTVQNGQATLVSQNNVQRGSLSFDAKSAMSMTLASSSHKIQAGGTYRLQGKKLYVSNLKAKTAGDTALPDHLLGDVAWQGADSFVVTFVGNDALFVRRKTNKNPLVAMIRLGVEPKGAEMPGELRGMVAQVKSSSQLPDGEDQ